MEKESPPNWRRENQATGGGGFNKVFALTIEVISTKCNAEFGSGSEKLRQSRQRAGPIRISKMHHISYGSSVQHL